MLLPDGSVLAAGGDTDNFCNCPVGSATCPTAQIYYPGYLFRTGTVPVIGTLPNSNRGYGQELIIPTDQADQITKVVLIRSSSVTHSFNMEQRFLELQILNPPPRNGQVNVKTPANASIAPQGFYMLFIVTGTGDTQIPSMAKFVRLSL